MMLTKEQFAKLRANVKKMNGFRFTKYIRGNVQFERYVYEMFDQSPYDWLYRQGITRITLADYRDYCVRWLDHIKKDVCL